ncbi:hypothetical protein RSP673_005905 [Ralstonia solanacearum P673]|uniref:hypothetical protein n=1 Tax=Ralstonia solanacearum TaxID=305 RepID=UPI00202A7579|nr:hypothetical protein [Ralstonia solanacearum]MCL9851994.1 hypothetical protein [Ralstonia solanacearum]MCL9856950.1 hypothetical protein [Ralstonia solanacearum]MCL9858579.1 hypothetical protein [Ralstonia solanacearum]MCL9866545.1 hypothetical protein [Ralstonia solanacearum]MCL9871327.1 hypothetical protein [Ralstonia solanacearum]
MTQFVVAFFEGAHDANFVGRLLVECGSYSDEEVKVQDLPSPMDKFLVELYRLGNVEGQTIGKAERKMPPAVALRSANGDRYFLGFVTNGVTNTEPAHDVIDRLMAFARRDEVAELTAPGHKFALIFFFDADDHGRDQTEFNFSDAYQAKLQYYDAEFVCPKHQKITTCTGIPVGLYVFCDGTGTGTLEDCITRLIFASHKEPLDEAISYLKTNNVDLPFEAKTNAVASRAKQYKAALTVLGQREKKIAGSSLAVILRDSTTFTGKFDLTSDPVTKAIKDLTDQLLL